MSWLRKLFRNGEDSQNSYNSGDNWYFSRSKDGKIAQMILSCPVSCIKDTEFGYRIWNDHVTI